MLSSWNLSYSFLQSKGKGVKRRNLEIQNSSVDSSEEAMGTTEPFVYESEQSDLEESEQSDVEESARSYSSDSGSFIGRVENTNR